MSTTSPILIFGYGNPSRGDDALGPSLVSKLEDQIQPDHPLYQSVELLTDFQLQVEHAMDLVGRELVVFVDASVALSSPYDYTSVAADEDTSYTTHAMSPAAVLHVYECINGTPAPPCHLLSIRGREFGLGKPMTPDARASLDSASKYLLEQLKPWHG